MISGFGISALSQLMKLVGKGSRKVLYGCYRNALQRAQLKVCTSCSEK